MNREAKLEKLTSLLGEIFGVWRLPSESEMHLYLERASDEQIDRTFFSLYDAKLMSMQESLEAFNRGRMIEKIKEVYFEISEPEGSA